MTKETLNKLNDLIVEVTGNDPDSIKPESDLEEDLGIVLDEDFERLISSINQDFEIELDAEEINDVVTTVGDLANIIEEELELG